jgi:hypothetical protein
MNGEVPLELEHLVARLHVDFDGRLRANIGSDAEEKEKNFLSRALAAFAIHRLAHCTLDEAAANIVDGGGDFGLDAIYFSSATETLWLVQSKFDGSGRGEPELGDVSKFCDGIDALLRGTFEPFADNAEIMRRRPDLVHQLNTPGLQVRTLLIYSGLAVVSEDRRHLFDRLRLTFSADSDYLIYKPYNLTSIHDWVTGADEPPGVAELDLTLEKPGWIKRPFESLYGRVRLNELFALTEKYGQRLIAANLRGYKGSTDVNKEIYKTLEEEPENFFYLNNGLTAYCERLEVKNVDRGNEEQKRVTMYGFSIVNGAQTLGSIRRHARKHNGQPADGYVSFKVVSLYGCEDDREFAARITRTTNFQNQITIRDFVAQEEEQVAIAQGLAPSGVYYHYKDADDTPSSDETNFGLDEATTALACLEQQQDCDLLSRIVAQRKALWSFDPVYPATEIHRTRYGRLFRTLRSARSIWRAVQTQRIVLQALRTGETGIRKDFFENGRWLVLNAMFLRLHPQDGEALALGDAEIRELTAKAQEYAESLWNECRSKGFVVSDSRGGWIATKHFRSVFSASGDCQVLRNGMLATLSKTRNPSPTT